MADEPFKRIQTGKSFGEWKQQWFFVGILISG